ncbi:MAG TPA: hypothetical protein VJB94_00630 [Candidatus Nanoarchaeia archaeon]|nr:hypothetical protein [Candidatus Nanoarchaeia archaeon]
MEAKILTQKDADLLNRKEVVIEINHAGTKTPTKLEVVKKTAELLKTEESLVQFKKINEIFGIGKCKALVHIYKDINDLNRLEKIKKKPKKTAEAPKVAPKK